MKNRILLLVFIGLLSILFFQFGWKEEADDFVFYIVKPNQEQITFHLKNKNGSNYGSLANLKYSLDDKLLFAMNGGMYKKDKSPQGLFIENTIIKTEIDTSKGDGNFYLKPNGVFCINIKNAAFICKTEDFKGNDGSIKFATQSGPMLLIDGKIHSSFKKGSANLNIRNGVGILPNGNVIFALSKKEVNFYDFAFFFKEKGCKNALYLDGFVSRAYCPSQKWIQTDGDFGVIIAVTKNK
jgi:uncharacterized protein YigE (DUF2233 family)